MPSLTKEATGKHTLHNVQAALLLAIGILVRAHAGIALQIDKGSASTSVIHFVSHGNPTPY
jgi:hypothetical protein